ncbi:MAG: sulfatase-like hydrolase/transferase [Rikenellaceae bacterium]
MRTLTTQNLALGAVALIAASCASEAEQPRPNILVLMTDDQSYSTIHAMGNDQVVTPNLDALVKEGVTFNRHYATTSISMASRACLMSGMYEYHNGCNFMRGAQKEAVFAQSYPVLMRNDGYYTAFGGKFGFPVSDEPITGKAIFNVDDYLPIEQFDGWAGQGHHIHFATNTNTFIARYAEEHPHLTSALGAFGKEQIVAAKELRKPFCISIYFKAPHGTFTPDPRYDHIYRDTVFRQPANYGEEFGRQLAMQPKLGRQHMEYFSYYHADYQNTARRINTLVYGVDVVVGELRKQLKECGVDDNTIIIFTSDNGYSLGEKSLGGKVLPYEETSRVPLIIYDPRNKSNSGKQSDAVAGNVDITATILDYAGIERPKQMDGVSLRDIVESPESGRVREFLPLMNTWGNPQIISLSVVTDEWKYIYYPYGEAIDPAEELFNVNDIFELKNLAHDPAYAAVMAQMRGYYDEQLAMIARDRVDDYDYPTFTTIYDRNIPWSQKKPLFTEEQWQLYDGLLKRIQYTGDKFDYEAVMRQNRVNYEQRKANKTVNPHTIEKRRKAVTPKTKS